MAIPCIKGLPRPLGCVKFSCRGLQPGPNAFGGGGKAGGGGKGGHTAGGATQEEEEEEAGGATSGSGCHTGGVWFSIHSRAQRGSGLP